MEIIMWLICNISDCPWQGTADELVTLTDNVNDRDFDFCPNCNGKDFDEEEEVED